MHHIWTIWYRNFIQNNQSLLIGTIIGYKQSSERAIEDLTYTPISDSKLAKKILKFLGLKSKAPQFKLHILRLRYTFLKMWNRIVRSRCYNKRPVGSFRWSRFQSNSFGWSRIKIRNQNPKSIPIWRSSYRNLFTF